MATKSQLEAVITALGGTPSGRTNRDLLAQVVTLLGGTPSGNSIQDMVGGIAEVADNLTVTDPQTKTVTPKTTKQNVTADSGKHLEKVVVNAVTSAIDANITAENIKAGVTILGVEGTYTGDPAEPAEPAE